MLRPPSKKAYQTLKVLWRLRGDRAAGLFVNRPRLSIELGPARQSQWSTRREQLLSEFSLAIIGCLGRFSPTVGALQPFVLQQKLNGQFYLFPVEFSKTEPTIMAE